MCLSCLSTFVFSISLVILFPCPNGIRHNLSHAKIVRHRGYHAYCFMGPGYWRFWNWNDRIHHRGFAAGNRCRLRSNDPVAAYMATSYALGVFVGAPVLIILGSRLPKNHAGFLAGLFVLGNLVTALAPSIGIAIVGRIITSLTHGAFFGIGSVLAAEMVPKEKRVSAIAFMFSGLTVANLIGVPVGTWISHQFSWQATFYVITVIGVATAVGVIMLIPPTAKPKAQHIGHEFAAFGNSKSCCQWASLFWVPRLSLPQLPISRP
nr:MFS transporter [Pectobacterium sp. PL152]